MAEGASTSLKGLIKEHIADFVHGTDGFGNTSQAAVEVRLCTGRRTRELEAVAHCLQTPVPRTSPCSVLSASRAGLVQEACTPGAEGSHTGVACMENNRTKRFVLERA